MTIASMTAFARSATQQEWGQAIWEIRSVNHRYLDTSFKMPENFREWEVEWRHVIANLLQRGKIECQLSFFASSQTAPHLHINKNLVEQLISNCEIIAGYPGVKSAIKAMDLLRWPEVVKTTPRELSFLKEPLSALLNDAVNELSQSRHREGLQLQKFLLARLTQIRHHIGSVQNRLPASLALQKQRIMQKMSEIPSLDMQRLEQELVFYAQRIDIEEEVERLVTHVQEVERTLSDGAAVGRRLDFFNARDESRGKHFGCQSG